MTGQQDQSADVSPFEPVIDAPPSAGTLAARAAAARSGAPGAHDVSTLPSGRPSPGAPVDSAPWSARLHRRAEDLFVIDGVAHCYNHSEINRRIKRSASKTLDSSSAYHEWCTPQRFRMTPEQWGRDWQPEEMMDVLFLESPTDMIVMHSIPMYDVYWDGLVSNQKGAFLKGKYPDRVLWYGAVDAFDSLESNKAVIDQLCSQGVDGIKLYPTRVNTETFQSEGWFMDDERIAFPLFEYARSKGVRNIGTHKLVGYSPEKYPALGINDYYRAAAQFPDITFHIVHGGWMLLEETAELMRAHQNVTCVLEGPMIWPHYDNSAFDRMWSVFMQSVDVDRIIYASSAPNQHPYWTVVDFVDYDPPKGSGFRFTEEDKAKILGLNLARCHGIDVPAQQAKIAGDKFARYKAAHGYREPYVVQREPA